MSRMFNVLSGGSSARAAAESPSAAARSSPRAEAASEVALVDEIPFVEIGGPAGPVYSAGLNLLKLPETAKAPKPAEAPAPTPADERTFPRLATPKYLSVTFHDLTGRKRNEIEREGPDSGLVALHLPDHPISGEYR